MITNFKKYEKVTYHKTLSTDIWEGDKLIERIRTKLIKIAYDFHEYLKIDSEMSNILMVGSMANYNYTKFSDIDLHIVVDFSKVDENFELVKSDLNGKKFIWNLRHNISIKGHDVELYAQDISEEVKSSGIYSISNDSWILKPQYSPPTNVNTDDVDFKFENYVEIINTFEEISKKQLTPKESEEYHEKAKLLKSKIHMGRKEGLAIDGEFAIDNLVFKKLRNSGDFKRLIDLIMRFYDKIYSQ